MFGTLGGPEVFLILVVALIVFGPRKLPEMGKSLGRMIAEFRKASNEFQRTIEDEVAADRFKSETRPLASPAGPATPAGLAASSPVGGEPPAATPPADTVSRDATPIEPK
jgi:TatA/E family protein of Tat protein translocase